jgi:hypothetical protein
VFQIIAVLLQLNLKCKSYARDVIYILSKSDNYSKRRFTVTTFLWILLLVLFVALIFGLVKPSKFLFWSKKPKRWKVAGWWLLASFVVMLAISAIEDYSRTPQQLMSDAKAHMASEDYITAIYELERITPEDAALYAEAQKLIPRATALQREQEKKEAEEEAIREEQQSKREAEEKAEKEKLKRKEQELKARKEAEKLADKQQEEKRGYEENKESKTDGKTDNSWLIGVWQANTANYGIIKLIFHDSRNFTDITKFGSEKGTYTVNGDNITLYHGSGNTGTSVPINRANKTLSAGHGDYYRKVQ